MTIQVHEPHSNKKQNHKRSSWVLRTVVSAVILAIIAFSVVTFLILQNQDTAQRIRTLTIISIVVGVVIGLLSLMISFLQLHHPKPSTMPEPFTSPSTKIASSNISDGHSSPVNTTGSLGVQSNKDVDELASSPKVDWDEAPQITLFYGRENELAQLEQWIEGDGCHLVAVLGFGGIGKTALVAKLAERIQDKFEHIFWRSLQNAPPLENIRYSPTNW